MYVHTEGVGYSLYLQNDKYAKISQKEGNGTATAEESKSLRDYLDQITESIPELKAAEESGSGIGVFILPNSSSTLQQAVDTTTQKMLDEGTDESLLKDVLGIVKDNYSMDIDYGNGVAHIKNAVDNYDMDALNSVLDKFKDIFTNNGQLSQSLGTFQSYISDVYDILKSQTSSSTQIAEASTSTNTNNDLVDTLTQEMDKEKEDGSINSDELNKKLYKNFIKELKKASTGTLLQQNA